MKNLAALLTILSMVVTPCLAQCVNETVALASNQAVEDAYNEMNNMLENAITANPLEFCNVASATCTIDFQDYSSNVDSNCTAQDGQLVERDVTTTCNGTVQEIPIPDGFTINVNNAPLCVGASCDATSIPSELEAKVKTIIETLVAELNTALGSQLECDVNIDNGGSTPAPNTGGGDTTGAPSEGGGAPTSAPMSAPSPAPISAPNPAPISAPTPAPTSGAQSTTILVTAAGVALLSSILM